MNCVFKLWAQTKPSFPQWPVSGISTAVRSNNDYLQRGGSRFHSQGRPLRLLGLPCKPHQESIKAGERAQMQGLEQVRAWTEQSAGIFTARCREASDTLGIICEEVCLHPWSLMRRHSLAVLNPGTSLPPCSMLGISWENGRGGCVSEVGSMSQSCIRLQEITELQRSRHACKFVSLKNNVYCIFSLYVCCLIKITILKVAAYVGVCFSYTPGVPLQKFS